MPEMRVEWSVTVVDRRETWTLKLYEDGVLMIQHNEHVLSLNSGAVMQMIDVFCGLFGLNKRGL